MRKRETRKKHLKNRKPADHLKISNKKPGQNLRLRRYLGACLVSLNLQDYSTADGGCDVRLLGVTRNGVTAGRFVLVLQAVR